MIGSSRALITTRARRAVVRRGKAPIPSPKTMERQKAENRKRPGKTWEQTNDPATVPEDKTGSEQEQTRPTKTVLGKSGKREGAKDYGRGVGLAVTAEHTSRPHESALCAQALPPLAPQQSYPRAMLRTGRCERRRSSQICLLPGQARGFQGDGLTV